ncbi:FAD-binding oxidoreductase [Micromonospora sp. WMMB482]|nr:FAD-binding oxidoreductase [Micromonospora sp. WMMB482]
MATGDHQVDPRRLVAALRTAAERAGVELRPARVGALSEVDAGVTVVAAGCGAAGLTGLPVRPVKGQVLRLRAPGGGPPGFRHVIRGYADSEPVYLVPGPAGRSWSGDSRGARGHRCHRRWRADAAARRRGAGAGTRRVRAGGGRRRAAPRYTRQRAIIGPLPGRPGVLAATGTTATASCSPGHRRPGHRADRLRRAGSRARPLHPGPLREGAHVELIVNGLGRTLPEGVTVAEVVRTVTDGSAGSRSR